VFDLAIDLDGRSDALAVMGEALVSIDDAAAGIPVTAVREVVARRLVQETPGQLGAITRAIGEAGIRVDVTCPAGRAGAVGYGDVMGCMGSPTAA
jgi:hypothetical protein